MMQALTLETVLSVCYRFIDKSFAHTVLHVLLTFFGRTYSLRYVGLNMAQF